MKKLLTIVVIVAMVFGFTPFAGMADSNAYAATSLVSAYNLNQIDAPKTVYTKINTRGNTDDIILYSSVPENIYNMLLDADKDYDGFKGSMSNVGVELE